MSIHEGSCQCHTEATLWGTTVALGVVPHRYQSLAWRQCFLWYHCVGLHAITRTVPCALQVCKQNAFQSQTMKHQGICCWHNYIPDFFYIFRARSSIICLISTDVWANLHFFNNFHVRKSTRLLGIDIMTNVELVQKPTRVRRRCEFPVYKVYLDVDWCIWHHGWSTYFLWFTQSKIRVKTNKFDALPLPEN